MGRGGHRSGPRTGDGGDAVTGDQPQRRRGQPWPERYHGPGYREPAHPQASARDPGSRHSGPRGPAGPPAWLADRAPREPRPPQGGTGQPPAGQSGPGGYRNGRARYRDTGYGSAVSGRARARETAYGEPRNGRARHRESYGRSGDGQARSGEPWHREGQRPPAGDAGRRAAFFPAAGGAGQPAYRGTSHRRRSGTGPWPEDAPGARSQQQWRRGERGGPRRRDTTGGAEGNERLTAMTGAVVLVLLAAEGVTILAIHRLLTLHFFLGTLLVGPVLLKGASTVYRFARYYAGAPAYRRKGPPAPLLRALGPLVLVLSLTVIGSGIMLAVTGPGGQFWLFAHKASFVLWFLVMTVHVLAYVWRLPRLISGDLVSRARVGAAGVLAGRQARWLLLTAAVLTGLMLAVLTVHLAAAWAHAAPG
jgi:hypothetical protein